MGEALLDAILGPGDSTQRTLHLAYNLDQELYALLLMAATEGDNVTVVLTDDALLAV